jgi:rhodanese-related sulfurtransferase
MDPASASMSRRGDPRPISREEIRRRLSDQGLTIVNVLPREAWRNQRIPGSISLPLDEIPDKATDVLGARDREIAVYCGSFT